MSIQNDINKNIEEEVQFLKTLSGICKNNILTNGVYITTGFGESKRIEPNPAYTAYMDIWELYRDLMNPIKE